MKKEIGSEFWNTNLKENHKHFFLSGRTALDFIIRDIMEKEKMKSVLLPSYCCHTMIEPFIRNGLEVRFYQVRYEAQKGLLIELPEFRENEIFYYMTYFGYCRVYGLDEDHIREFYKVIIEDKTHSWLSEFGHINADYSYISYRKWSGYSGIAMAEKQGSFQIVPDEIFHNEYVSLREKALDLKAEYIFNGEGNKDCFLELFGNAEELLEQEYVGYKPSYKAMENFLKTDWNEIKEKRRRNAKILVNGLKKCKGINVVFSEVEENDVPLFVPIILNERDALKNYLIQNRIYCPAHWPLSVYHASLSAKERELYNKELSLVCDQRYNEEDMYRIIESVSNFLR